MRNRLAVGLVALSLPLLGAASPAHAAAPVEYHYDDGGYCAAGHDGCGGGYREGDYYEGGRDEERKKKTCFMGCDNIIIIPGLPGMGGGDQAPPEERTQSLFPPSPEAIRDFVLATFKAGIEMGRLFADTTITFVTNLFVGIA